MTSPITRLRQWKHTCHVEMMEQNKNAWDIVKGFVHMLHKFDVSYLPSVFEPRCDALKTTGNVLLCGGANVTQSKKILFLQVPHTPRIIRAFDSFSAYEAKYLVDAQNSKQYNFIFGKRSFNVVDFEGGSKILKILIMGHPIHRIYNYYQTLRYHRLPSSCTTFKKNTTFSSWYLRNYKRIPEINNYEIRLLASLKYSRSLVMTADVQCLMHYRYCFFPTAFSSLPDIKKSDVYHVYNTIRDVSFVGISEYPETITLLKRIGMAAQYEENVDSELSFTTRRDHLEFNNIRNKIEEDNWGSLFVWKHVIKLFMLQLGKTITV